MVLGCFNPHFNADISGSSTRPGKQKYCIFCVFVTVFVSVSKSGNLNNWHFPEKIEGPQGACEVYQPTIVGLYGQY